MPKALGLLCGMTYHSTVTHYTLINTHTSTLTNGKHTASLLLHSFDSPPMMALMTTGQWPKFTSIVCTAANNLKASGAQAIVMCANIMHKAAAEVESRTGLPVLHIADFTGRRVVDRGFKRVGLLATKAVMEEAFYKDRLREKFGLDVLIPGNREMDETNRVIFEELANGIVTKGAKELFMGIVKDFVDRGAECVILACTDLVFVIKQEDVDVPIFETTEIHAEGVAEWALEEGERVQSE